MVRLRSSELPSLSRTPIAKVTDMSDPTCSIDGCDGRLKARRLCGAHYWRLLKHGEPGGATIRRAEPGRLCSLEGCERAISEHAARGMCAAHYQRWLKYGEPGDAVIKRIDGDDVGYRAAHRRVWKLRGRASAHPCQHCGGTAAHWAYDHLDINEKLGETGKSKGVSYSTDPDHYFPLCVPCHSRFDLLGRVGELNASSGGSKLEPRQRLF